MGKDKTKFSKGQNGEHAPSGTKRINNLLRHPGWNDHVVENYLWQQADQTLEQHLHPHEDVYVIWDESVIEKPESLKAERLCAVRSSKARRLRRIKPGYYNPPGGRHVFVPGLNWLQVLIAGMKGAPALAHIRFWTTREEAKTTKWDEEHRLLQDLSKRWGKSVIHLWDRGFASAPWLGTLLPGPFHCPLAEELQTDSSRWSPAQSLGVLAGETFHGSPHDP
jgi:hypothetical protein